jgi:hypothetical protein
VWDYSCDAKNLTYEPYYPGDDAVDWWGVNIFSGPSGPNDTTCVLPFIQLAASRGFPIMIGAYQQQRSACLRMRVLSSAASSLRQAWVTFIRVTLLILTASQKYYGIPNNPCRRVHSSLRRRQLFRCVGQVVRHPFDSEMLVLRY